MQQWLKQEKAQWQPCAAVFRAYAPLLLKTALLGMFLCHALFVVYGYTSPDGTNEGLYYYWNQRWALSIGRWMMPALSAVGANVVMPAVFMAFNALCTALTVLLLADLWQVRSKAPLVLAVLSLVVAPSVIEQNLVICVAYSYGFSMLLTTLAAYLVLARRGWHWFAAAVVCLALGLGGYQAWVGFTAGIVVMTLLLDCSAEMPLPQLLRRLGRAAAMGLLGGALYFAVLQVETRRAGVPLSSKGGLSEFGAGSLLGHLGQGVLQAYRDFAAYYTSGPNHTGKARLLVLLGAVLLGALFCVRLLRRRQWQQAVAALVLALALPLAVDLVDVVVEGEVNTLMSHPLQMVIPFALALAWRAGGPLWWRRLVRLGAAAAVVLVCWLGTVVAYASYQTVAMAYRYVGTLTDAILTRVLNDPAYDSDKRVLIAGLPDESEAQKFNFLFDKSAYTKNMVFWDGTAGVLGNWKHYIYDYHGLWIGEVSTDEYYDIIDSEAFEAMPVYPAEGSLQTFGDILVVKLEEDPPR